MDKEYLWELIYKVIGRIRIPSELKERKEEVVLHISDTPYSIFPALNNLILKLKPEYIIHTGDLIDNIKLELYPKSIDRYKLYLKNLMKILQKPFVKGIYISLGNHDDMNAILEYINLDKRITITKESRTININNKTIQYSHYLSKLSDIPNSIELYGHDTSVKEKYPENSIYLNGIESINIIMLTSAKIYKLQYPIGTDDARLKKGRVGF